MSALDGIRVLELASFISGPLAGELLGDLGAEVIKIEPATGDPFRQWVHGDYSPQFRTFNRNKLSMVLDFRTEAGRRILDQLAAEVDVVVQNLRPAAARRLGLSYDQLCERNPRVVVCGISAFGDRGPDVDKPGFDTMGQAVGGLMSLFVDPADPHPVGPAMADQLAGVYAAYGVLGALAQRSITGLGQQVSTSLLTSSAAFAAESIMSTRTYGTVADRYTRAAGSQAFAFTCRDGEVVAIHLSSPEKFWRGLIEAVEDPGLAVDERFSNRAGRVSNYDALYSRLAPSFLRRDRDDWLGRLSGLDVPCAPVSTVAQVADHPQANAMGVIRQVSHPIAGDSDQVSNPVEGELQREVYLAPPLLGEHTVDVLTALGMDSAEIAELVNSGVVRTGPDAAPHRSM